MDTMLKLLILGLSIILLNSCVETARRDKRSAAHFGLMIAAVVKDRFPWEFNDYGCYCGLGGEGPTLDGLDQCCSVHDKCYESVPDQNPDCVFPYLPYTVLYGFNYDPLECTDDAGSCERLTCECDRVAALCFATNPFNPGLKNIGTCKPCAGYGEITDIKVTGAKSATAKAEGVSSTGVVASQNILDQDIAELEDYRSCFVQVANEYGIHPALIGGLVSRVSRAGKLLTAQGYGTRNANKYGLMQCDTTQFGTQCTQHGPTSCDHIEMMVREKLAPDLRKALEKKYTVNRERKGQRDAVAAYEHTVSQVWTWSSPDSKTTGGDFSSDVISRAHRLIYHHKWTCDGTDPSPWLSGTVDFVPSVTPGSDTCKTQAELGDCEFYNDCVESKLHCSDAGYPVGFGYRYCTRFSQFYADFSVQGKKWVDAVLICLMKTLLPQTSTKMTCDRIRKIAFDSHLKCFGSTGVDICSFVEDDIDHLWNVFKVSGDFIGIDALAVWKQLLVYVFACDGDAYETGKGSVIGINGDINAWQKSEIGEAIETTERKRRRRKRSLDCEQYARWGDCRFYECFEAKFDCTDHQGYSHVKDFELTSCMKFSGLSLSNIQVGLWMTSTQHCLMDHLMDLYDQESVDCELVELHMLEARVSCMIDAGFCDLDTTDEWIIERATDRKGYPYIGPSAYTTLPENKDFVIIGDYYYQHIPVFNKLIGLANKKCFEMGKRETEEMYKLVDTAQLGQFKIRTEL